MNAHARGLGPAGETAYTVVDFPFAELHDLELKYLRITIGDDGKGFNYKETLQRVKKEKKSYGLVGMIERIEQLQGTINIESDEGLGTVFNIKLPINREVILDE